MLRFAFCVSCLFELRFRVVGFWFWIVVFTWCLGVDFVVGIFFLARGSCFGFGLWLMCLCIQQLHFTEYHVIPCGFMDSHGISWMLI